MPIIITMQENQLHFHLDLAKDLALAVSESEEFSRLKRMFEAFAVKVTEKNLDTIEVNLDSIALTNYDNIKAFLATSHLRGMIDSPYCWSICDLSAANRVLSVSSKTLLSKYFMERRGTWLEVQKIFKQNFLAAVRLKTLPSNLDYCLIAVTAYIRAKEAVSQPLTQRGFIYSAFFQPLKAQAQKIFDTINVSDICLRLEDATPASRAQKNEMGALIRQRLDDAQTDAVRALMGARR